jgi:hypothetical protein
VGLTVHWTNQGNYAHTTTQDSTNPNGSPGLGLWDSGNLAPSPVSVDFSIDFEWAATYPYHCKRHPNVTGTVRIGVLILDVLTEEGPRYRIRWANEPPPGEDLRFDVQIKRPGEAQVFDDWRPLTEKRSGLFTPKGSGTFAFRARLVKPGQGLILGSTPYSPPRSVNVQGV